MLNATMATPARTPSFSSPVRCGRSGAERSPSTRRWTTCPPAKRWRPERAPGRAWKTYLCATAMPKLLGCLDAIHVQRSSAHDSQSPADHPGQRL